MKNSNTTGNVRIKQDWRETEHLSLNIWRVIICGPWEEELTWAD